MAWIGPVTSENESPIFWTIFDYFFDQHMGMECTREYSRTLLDIQKNHQKVIFRVEVRSRKLLGRSKPYFQGFKVVSYASNPESMT